MKSYILGLIVAMILSVAYAFQNTITVTVNFFGIQKDFSQGVWEVILFSAGALIMWVFSVCASIETYLKYRKKTKELRNTITTLEEEKKSLWNTLQRLGETPEIKYPEAEEQETSYYVPVNESRHESAIELSRTPSDTASGGKVTEAAESAETSSDSSLLSYFKSFFKSKPKSTETINSSGKVHDLPEGSDG
jgi:uncharacterized integral membrane protein